MDYTDVRNRVSFRRRRTVDNVVEGRKALSWALDLLDMYDELLIKMGEPREKVYSSIHLQGKEKARVALAASAQPVAPKETK